MPNKNANKFESQLKPVLYMWQDKVLYIGRLPSNIPHSIPVSTLSINLCNLFKVSSNKGLSWHECRSVFWPANLSHESIYNEDVMVFFLMEPTANFDFVENNMKLNQNGFYYGFEGEENLIDIFSDIYLKRPSVGDVKNMIDSTIAWSASMSEKASRKDCLDKRIAALIHSIKKEPTKKRSVDELAGDSGLSRPYLMQLFKEQAGMPIGKFQLWVRLLFSLRLVLSGRDVTTSALSGGFSDAAHFSRTFKKMIGMSISSLFMSDKGVDFFSDIS